MRLLKIFFVLSLIFLLVSSVAAAGDFDWTRDLNIKAEADPSGFRAMLGTRFNIGDAEIRTVFSNVEKSADAYMMLRLGEMSGHPVDYVTEQYKSGKGKGWGTLAKNLGIKPGSEEFHALKNGHDLYGNKARSKDGEKGKGKGKIKGKK